MSNQDSDAKIVEPLAKFHAQPTTKGRITIPKETRKLDPQTKKPTKRAVLIARLNTTGQCVIPSELIKQLGIKIRGETIEVLLLSFFKPEEVLADKVLFSKYRTQLLKRDYAIISEDDEAIISFQL